ncbi:asparagine synthase-related protein [Fibrobacterota bacterium]
MTRVNGSANPEETRPLSWIGDILIAFKDAGDIYAERVKVSPWELMTEDPEWKVHVCPGGSLKWKGTPYRRLTVDGWEFWVLGEFYDTDDGASQLKRLTLSSEDGNGLNGYFLIFAWEARNKKWHIWTDRFGSLHAYYTVSGSRRAISTYSPALYPLTAKELDWSGITGFMSTGIFPQDRTYYQDVKIFRPASHYVFDSKGSLVKQERYWRWCHKQNFKRSYQETLVQLDDLFKSVIFSHSNPGRVGIPLSGGLDSRTIVACLDEDVLERKQKSIFAYSYGYYDKSPETEISRRIAEERALAFEKYTIGPYLFDKIEDIVACVEGFQDVNQCRQAFVMERFYPKVDYVLGGHMGDLWFDTMGVAGNMANSMSDDACAAHVLHKIERIGRNWLQRYLCRPMLGSDGVEALLRHMVKEELDAVSHIQDRDFQIKAYKVEQWVFRLTNGSSKMYQAGAFPKMPFYDTRFTDFIATVPNACLRGRRLQIDYLKKFAPELARVKWEVYDTTLFRLKYFNNLLLPKRAVKKFWRTVRGKRPIELNWEVQLLNSRGREGLEHWLLRKGLRLHDFVSPNEIKRLVDSFYQDPYAEKRGYTVSMLLTFSAWLELLS